MQRSTLWIRVLFLLVLCAVLVTMQQTPAASGDEVAVVVANIPTVESPHPYPANSDAEWTISNTTGQNALRVYFTRIVLEEGIDRIEISDQDSRLVQVIDYNAPDGLWSDIVPGPIAIVRLISDSVGQHWGFEAQRIEGVHYATLARSAHPYPNALDDTQFVLNDQPSPQGTRVHFDRVDLEDQVDWLVIQDANGVAYQWITGTHNSFTSKAVPGAALKIQHVTDGSVNAWGYNVDAVQSAPPSTPDAPPTFPDTLAETPHPIGGDYSNTWTLVNPDPNAVSTKIHFSQLSLSQYDSLGIRDANDNLVQHFHAGGTRLNLWTDYVPGRIVKISYFKSRWYDNWGFRADAIRTADTPPVLAESPHPYPSGIDQTWTVVNPDPQAKTTKVRFDWLHIAGYDSLTIMDEDDLVIQRFGSGNWGTVWSDYVTGRVVKIRLFESDHYEGWGFRINAVANGPDRGALAESPHPYPSNIDQTWSVVNPNAAAAQTQVFFEWLDIAGYDRLDVMDSGGTVIQTFGGGTHQENYWSNFVPGRVVQLRLRESDHYEGWGFRVTDVYSPGGPAPTPAYIGGLYLTLTGPATVSLDGVTVIQTETAGDYKLAFASVGQYTVRIAYPTVTEILRVIRRADGGLQVLPGAVRTGQAVETASAAALILPHGGDIHVEEQESILGAAPGEYIISLENAAASDDHAVNLTVIYHERQQALTVTAGTLVHRLYLPGVVDK